MPVETIIFLVVSAFLITVYVLDIRANKENARAKKSLAESQDTYNIILRQHVSALEEQNKVLWRIVQSLNSDWNKTEDDMK